MHLLRQALLILMAARALPAGHSELLQSPLDPVDEAESRPVGQNRKDVVAQSDQRRKYPNAREHPYEETVARVYWPLDQYDVHAVTVAMDTNDTGAVSLGVHDSQVAVTPQAVDRSDETEAADDTTNKDIEMGGIVAVDPHAALTPPREDRQCPSTWEDLETHLANEAVMIADPTTVTDDATRPVEAEAEAKAAAEVLDSVETEAGVEAEARASRVADTVLEALVTPEEAAATGQAPLRKVCADDASRLPPRRQVRAAKVEEKAEAKVPEKDHTANTASTLQLATVVMVISVVLAMTSIPRKSETRSSRHLTNAESSASPLRAQLPWQEYWL